MKITRETFFVIFLWLSSLSFAGPLDDMLNRVTRTATAECTTLLHVLFGPSRSDFLRELRHSAQRIKTDAAGRVEEEVTQARQELEADLFLTEEQRNYARYIEQPAPPTQLPVERQHQPVAEAPKPAAKPQIEGTIYFVVTALGLPEGDGLQPTLYKQREIYFSGTAQALDGALGNVREYYKAEPKFIEGDRPFNYQESWYYRRTERAKPAGLGISDPNPREYSPSERRLPEN